MTETYDGNQINAVLTLVERMTQNGDVQLSIMAHALVIACKSTKVERETMIEEIGRLWDRGYWISRTHHQMPLRDSGHTKR